MSLPAFRLTSLRASPGWAQVARGLVQQLRGRVIALPRRLPARECEDVVDALALLLGWPVVVAGTRREAGSEERTIVVWVEPVADPPTPDGRAVIVCQLKEADPDRLSLPHELLVLRDAMIECLGRGPLTPALRTALRWVASVTDTPRSAAQFLGGVQAQALLYAGAGEADLYCAGLATAAADLLEPVSENVAQWVALLACGAATPERLLRGAARRLPRSIALKLASADGLVHDATQEHFTWRRPLDALGRLPAAPAAVTPAMAIAALSMYGPEDLRAALRILLATHAPSRLGLGGPPLAHHHVGREADVRRLVDLVAPQPNAERAPVVVLTGPRGAGKSHLAATAAGTLSDRLEPVWLSFSAGPELGLWPVARALGIETSTHEANRKDQQGVPAWARAVQGSLREGDFLVVIEETDARKIDELKAWLPTGAGRCSLVLLRREKLSPWEAPLEEITVFVPPLGIQEARHLLWELAPLRLHEAIDAGSADKLLYLLGGSPLAITLAAAILDGLDWTVLEREIYGVQFTAQAREEAPDAVWATVDLALRCLAPQDLLLLQLLSAYAAPGCSHILARSLASQSSDAAGLDRLTELGLLAFGRERIRVHALVAMRAWPGANNENLAMLMQLARAVLTCWRSVSSQGRNDQLEVLYLDLIETGRRFINVLPEQEEDVRIAAELMDLLASYSGGVRNESLTIAYLSYLLWGAKASRADWTDRGHELEALRRQLTGEQS